MTSINSPLSHLAQQQRPLALQYSILQVLPGELFVEIASYLDPASAALFAISCMHVKNLLKKHYDGAINGNVDTTKIAFLEMLERDMPDHVFCPTCKKLHKIENTQIFYGNYLQPECSSQDMRDNIPLYIDPVFRTSIFAMAMKRNTQARYQEADLLLGGLSSNGYVTTSSNSTQARLCRSSTRNIQSRRILCQERVCISTVSPTKCDFSGFIADLALCPHLVGWSSFATIVIYPGVILENGKLVVFYDQDGFSLGARYPPDFSSSDIIQCPCCFLECRFHFKWYEGHGLALFVTTWKDLGTGPKDPQFNRNYHRANVGPSIASPRGYFKSIWDAYKHEGDTAQVVPGVDFETFLDRMPKERARFLGAQKEYLKRSIEDRPVWT